MGISFSGERGCFHLRARDTSYVIGLEKGRYLCSRYWGPAIREWRDSAPLASVERPFTPNPDPEDPLLSLDTLPQEYPAFGNTDFRSPAYQVRQADGSTVTDLAYRSHRIIQGKPELEGLPSTYAELEGEAETLELSLFDELIGLEAVLSYTVFRDYDAIARSVRFRNLGKEPLSLARAMSASVDLPSSDYEMLHLAGDWARERGIVRRRLAPGMQAVESRRGASSHQHNPFIALLSPGAGEDSGRVFAMSLVYSGNFLAQAEVDRLGSTRLSMGINPFEFSWLLEPGQSFQSPEVVLVHSSAGLGGMSAAYHELYRKRLCRGPWRDRERPILVNNWEATYFDFDADKILALADEAKAAGLELCVLDDGWFGRRDNDRSSLGDWKVDERKLPLGMGDLASRVAAKGLGFGLWFEPEMVSPKSELYALHPDWCLHVPGRPRSEGRHQLVLDLCRPEVRDYIVEAVSSILRSAPVSYVKWDMNRHMTEAGSASLPPERQKECCHRYILGVYEVMARVTGAFPEVLFESCSGGGGRFDPGILAYMPQAWTSDNTDAVSRLAIQYGTSLVYPPVTMGSHVTAVPNHQVHRITPLEFRGDVAMSGNLGYELDLGKLSPAEKEGVARQAASYKEIRRLVQFGDFHRILSPFDGPRTAWIFVSKDRGEAWAAYYWTFAEPNAPFPELRLKGLDPSAEYRVEGSGATYGGDELMSVGLRPLLGPGDFQSCSWHLKRVGFA
jgi:alpha-galactosidase